jgi:hypothetical protein
MGAVGNGSLAVDTDRSIDRRKYLQIGISMAMRAMRSLLYSAYQVHSPPCRDLLTNQGSSKPLQTSL